MAAIQNRISSIPDPSRVPRYYQGWRGTGWGADWRKDLVEILQVFNVRSISPVRHSLTQPRISDWAGY